MSSLSKRRQQRARNRASAVADSPAPVERATIQMPHKYRVGQRVSVAAGRMGSVRHGSFEIIRLLPVENGLIQYRLRAVGESRECVADEGELNQAA